MRTLRSQFKNIS